MSNAVKMELAKKSEKRVVNFNVVTKPATVQRTAFVLREQRHAARPEQS